MVNVRQDGPCALLMTKLFYYVHMLHLYGLTLHYMGMLHLCGPILLMDEC